MTPIPPPSRKRARPRVRSLPVAVLVVVPLLLVGAAGAAVVTLSGNDTAPDAPGPTLDPSPSPTSLTLAATAPNGRFAFVRTVVASSGGVLAEPLGTVKRGTWTIALDCRATPCTGTIVSSAGETLKATYDGIRLSFTGTEVTPNICRFAQDVGEPIEVAGNTARLESRVSGFVTRGLSPTSAAAQEPVSPAPGQTSARPSPPPAGLQGSMEVVSKVTAFTGLCSQSDGFFDGTGTARRQITLTRLP